MAGYSGYSKSNNAIDAENDGKYPKTRAIQIVRSKTGCTAKRAWVILEEIYDGEWHHSSKYYNAVHYYDAYTAYHIIRFADSTV